MMLVCLMLITAFAACSNVDDPVDNGSESNEGTTATTEEILPETTVDPNTFIYPEDVKFGGKEFHILNCTRNQWNMIAYHVKN